MDGSTSLRTSLHGGIGRVWTLVPELTPAGSAAVDPPPWQRAALKTPMGACCSRITSVPASTSNGQKGHRPAAGPQPYSPEQPGTPCVFCRVGEQEADRVVMKARWAVLQSPPPPPPARRTWHEPSCADIRYSPLPALPPADRPPDSLPRHPPGGDGPPAGGAHRSSGLVRLAHAVGRRLRPRCALFSGVDRMPACPAPCCCRCCITQRRSRHLS